MELNKTPNNLENKEELYGSWSRIRPEGMHETIFGQCALRTGISWIAGS